MNYFENITIENNEYIKIISLKITIPIAYTKKEIIYSSKNAELIHIYINQNAIVNDCQWHEWNEHLLTVLIRDENISQENRCLFESWHISGINMEIDNTIGCSKNEINEFIFSQNEKIYEFLCGRKNITAMKYWKMSAASKEQDLTKPIFIKSILGE